MNNYTESKLVEQPAIKIFRDELGYEYIDAYHEDYGENSLLGRGERNEVVLSRRLQNSLIRLNPDVPEEALPLAIDELLRGPFVLTLSQSFSHLIITTGIFWKM